MSERVTHRGACHCGRVRIEVEAPARIEAIECNCSICSMTGYLHLIVPTAASDQTIANNVQPQAPRNAIRTNGV